MYPDKATQALFVLLRAGLWGTSPDDLTPFPLAPAEWDAVHAMARRQTVTALVYRGLGLLPESLLPPDALLMRWVAQVATIEQQHRRTNVALGRLYDIFRRQGLTPVLQKGQGIAMLYDEPTLRECGDIDLYFPRSGEWERAVQIIEAHGIPLQRMPDGSVSYIYDGIEVEHHTRLIDLHNPAMRKPLARLEAQYGYRTAELPGIPGEAITLPSPMLDLLLLDTHIMKHALGRGIGLRQLCDMARACHCHRATIDLDTLQVIHRKAGTLRWHRLLHTFMVEHLGLAAPFATPLASSAPLLSRVLAGGNFGHHLPGVHATGQSIWQRKLRTAHSFVRNARFACHHAPQESIWTFLHLLTGQIK